MGAKDRNRRAARRADPREVRPLILVVTEGKVTEPQYLSGLVRACRNPRVRVEVSGEHGVPRTLVEHAKDRKLRAAREAKSKHDDNLAYDEVWCVFDIDEHPNVAEARNMAAANGIELAVSNPCFEFWLVLHFRDSPGCRDRGAMQSLSASLVGTQGKAVDFSAYRNGYHGAVKRAATIDARAKEDGEEGRCPSTGVYRLTESIRGDCEL